MREDSLALLLTMLSVETDLDVLFAITIALGPNGDEPVPAPLIGLHTHPDAMVRSGVASSLGGCPDMVALDTLITLSADEDALVRASATFGLARLNYEDFPGCVTRSPPGCTTTTSTLASRPCTGWPPAVTNG